MSKADNKIRIIDLLNKIANGEYPKKIKYKGKEHEFNSKIQWYADYDGVYEWFISGNKLNDEVEILEDNTEEIEELGVDENGFIHTNNGRWKGRKLDVAFADKINELVKAINSIRKDKNND